MSFREKSAWVTVVTLVLLLLVMFLHAPPPWTLRPRSSPFMFQVIMMAAGLFVIIEFVAYAVMAVRSPREARAPQDERERFIALKATRIAAYVYALLSLASIFTIHLGANAVGVAYLVTLSFVISLIVNYSARIIYYRRGV